MTLDFYHYVHCPFCVRVRMAASFLGQTYESHVLPYDDEDTPVRFTGKKMLPIMLIDGKPMNESLDIICAIDTQNKLKVSDVVSDPHFEEFNLLLNKLGANVHNLAMPYWIWTPEFDSESRAYFQKKKEQKRGPFKDLVKKQGTFSNEISADLVQITKDLKPFYKSSTFSLYDILLSAHIWGLYVVPEFQFSEPIHNYLQSVKDVCKFNYHEDYWK